MARLIESSLWVDFTRLKSLDLLIACCALHHEAELVTFDADYVTIARAAPLRVLLLSRNIP